MEPTRLQHLIVTFAVGAVVTILLLIFEKPLDKIIDRIQPDPTRRYKSIVIAGCLVYVLVGAAISIYIVLIGFGVVPKPNMEGWQ